MLFYNVTNDENESITYATRWEEMSVLISVTFHPFKKKYKIKHYNYGIYSLLCFLSHEPQLKYL